MPDTECKEIILSENATDYIVETRYSEETFREIASEECFQYLGAGYYSFYSKQISADEINNYNYSFLSVPKLYGLMDTSALEEIGALRLQEQPTLRLKGQGTIVAIIDTGIDYQNPLFRFANGDSRILAIWDQTIQEGEPPQDFLFGSEYTQEQINQALQSEAPYEIVPSRDMDFHGTFMAGIAAGNVDEQADFRGVAPESYLLIVKLKQAKQYLKDYYLINKDAVAYQENDIMLALRYCLQFALDKDMPLSICLSVGSSQGSHNGESPLEQLLNQIATTRRVAVTVPIGNEGNERLHYSGKILRNQEYEEVEMRVGEGERGFTLELWGDSPDLFSVEFFSPSGEKVPRISVRRGRTAILDFIFDNTLIYVDYRLVESASGAELIFMRFQDPAPGIWKIHVYGTNIVYGQYNMWLPIQEFLSADTYFVRSDPNITLTNPSPAAEPISIGFYDSITGAVAAESGRGFTPRNAIKPDLIAPGVRVYGPGRRDSYVTRSGSSVAAALVAGVCAQFLTWGVVQGREEYISTSEIKQYLIRGARREENVAYPDEQQGFGKVDIYHALEVLSRL